MDDVQIEEDQNGSDVERHACYGNPIPPTAQPDISQKTTTAKAILPT